MKRIKISLALVALLFSIGAAFAGSAKTSLVETCYSLPNSGGTAMDRPANCNSTTSFCCYKAASSIQYLFP